MSNKIPEDINTEACNDKPGDAYKKAIINSGARIRQDPTPKYKVGDRVEIWCPEHGANNNVLVTRLLPVTQAGTFVYEVKEDLFYRKLPLKRTVFSEYEISRNATTVSIDEVDIKNRLLLIIENLSPNEDIVFNDKFYADHIRKYFAINQFDCVNGFIFHNRKIKTSKDIGYGLFSVYNNEDSFFNIDYNILYLLRNCKQESELSIKIRKELNIKDGDKLKSEAEIAHIKEKQFIEEKLKLELIFLNTPNGTHISFNEYYYNLNIARFLKRNISTLLLDFNGKDIKTNKSLGIGQFQIIDSYNNIPLSEPMSFDNLTEANLCKLRRGHFECNKSKELRKLLKIEKIKSEPAPLLELVPEPERRNCIPTSSIVEGEGLYVYGPSSDQCTGYASVNINGDIYSLSQLLTNIDGTVKSTLADSGGAVCSTVFTDPVKENTSSNFENVIWNDQIPNIIFPNIELPVIDNIVDAYEKVQASLREGFKSFIGAPINEETKKLMTDKVKKSFNEVVSGAYKQSLINILRLEYPFSTKTIYVNSDDYLELQLPATSDVIENDGRKLFIVKHPDIPSGFMYVAGVSLKQGEYPTLDKIRKTFGELYFVLNKDMSPNATLDAFENAYREQKMNKAEQSSAAPSNMTFANYTIKLSKNLDKLIETYKYSQNILINSEDFAQLLQARYNFSKIAHVTFIPCKEIISGFVYALNDPDFENVSNKEKLYDFIRLNPEYLFCISKDDVFALDSIESLRKYEASLVGIESKKEQDKSMENKNIEYTKKYDLLSPELKQVNDVLTFNKFLEDGEVLSSRMGNDAYELMMTDIVNYTKSFKRNLPYSLRASVEGNSLYSILNSIKDPMYHSVHFSTIFTFVDRLVEHKLLNEAKELMSIIKDLFRFHAGLSNVDPKGRIYCYFLNLQNNSQISSEMKSNSNREIEAEAQSIKKVLEQSKLKTMAEILHSFFTPIKPSEVEVIGRVYTTQDTSTSFTLTESIENNMDKTSSASETSTKKTLMQEGKEAFDVAKWRVAQRQAVRRFRDLLIVGLNQVGKDRSEVKALEKALKTKTGEGLISLCISFLSRMDMFAKHRNAEKFFTECRVEGLTVVSDEALEAFVGSAFPMIMGFISSSLDELPTVSVEVKQKPKKVRIHTKKTHETKDHVKEDSDAEEEMLASEDAKQGKKASAAL